jgi:hypothetical protein
MSLIELIKDRAANPAHRTDMSAHGGGFSSKTLDDPAIARAELQLGFQLPPILRAVYQQIGNGGFGPGYGLLPIVPGVAGQTENVVELYLAFKGFDPDEPAWRWPAHLLPFCDWGCAIRSCIDCSSANGPVITFDPNARDPVDDMSTSFAVTHATLEAWFRDWLAGTKIWDLMFEPNVEKSVEVVNPFTRKAFSVAPTKLRRPAG